MRIFLALIAVFMLASCGWTSGTRLIPVAERAVPELSGAYIFEGRTVTYGQRASGNLFQIRIDYDEQEPTYKTVAFDHLRTLDDGSSRERFYLIEVDNSSDEEASFGYDLIVVTQSYDEHGKLEEGKYVTQYNLACADATNALDGNPEGGCAFVRYSNLMQAVNDVFAWMDDPRIALEAELGSQSD